MYATIKPDTHCSLDGVQYNLHGKLTRRSLELGLTGSAALAGKQLGHGCSSLPQHHAPDAGYTGLTPAPGLKPALPQPFCAAAIQ
jgi:hypothetical protein